MTIQAYKHVSIRTLRASRARRRWLAVIAAALMFAPGAATAAATTTPPPDSARVVTNQLSPTQVSPELMTAAQSASQKAASTGEPVVVEEQTSETSQTTANPDGTFTLVANTQPVRIQQEDEWVPVDPTLEVRPDGSIGPKASTLDVTFSGGGAGPFTTLNGPGNSIIEMSWPQQLPAPTLNGNTATYPEILPGVDLQLTATETSYQQTLIVKDAVAAANPELQDLQVGISTEGLTLIDDGAGGLDAVDGTGTQVFDGQQPIMWDSAHDPLVGSEPTATDSGGATTAEIDHTLSVESATAQATESTLTLTPPADALTGEDVEYPVFIDPTFGNPSPLDWGFVFNNGWESYKDPANDLKVGKCIASGCEGILNKVGRTYFGFDAQQLTNRGSDIFVASAEVKVTQIHGYSACTPQPVDLLASNAQFSAATTYPGGAYGNPLAQQVSAVGDTCPAAGTARVTFSGATLTNHVQATLNSGNRFLDFALKSPDENNGNQWKRFASTGANAAPELVIKYGFPPSNIASLGVVGGFNCGGKTYVTNNDVTVQGRAQNNHPVAVSSAVYFDLFKPGGTTSRSEPGVGVPTGVTAAFTFPNLPDGSYQYLTQARSAAADYALFGTPSGKVSFTVQTAAPSTAPTVISHDFPVDFWGAPQNTGKFSISPGGATNVVGYAYGWDSAANIAAPTTGDCNNYTKVNGTAGGWLTANGTSGALLFPTGLTVGPHTLYVRSFTAAHNMSAQTTAYKFYVSPAMNVGHRYEGEFSPISNNFQQPVGDKPGDNSTHYQEAFPAASGGAMEHLSFTGADPNTGPEFKFSFTAINADYAFGVGMVKSDHFGKLKFGIENSSGTITWLNDPNTGAPYTFDGYNTAPLKVFQELGGLHLQSGAHKFVVKAIGKNLASRPGLGNPIDNGYGAALDYFIAVPINGATAASFTAAMNNNGIALNGTTANIGPSSTNASISENALKALPGYNTTTNKFTTGSITFGMPTNYAGNDNVIAMGQTIPFPGGTTLAPTVEILAAAACNTIIKRETVLAFTINYQSTSVDPVNPNLPTTPDFGRPAPTADDLDSYKAAGGSIDVFNTIAVAGTMPYRNSNGTQTTGGAILYRITLHHPFPNEPITSITLPNIGTNLTNDCSPSLHIFSISDPRLAP